MLVSTKAERKRVISHNNTRSSKCAIPYYILVICYVMLCYVRLLLWFSFCFIAPLMHHLHRWISMRKRITQKKRELLNQIVWSWSWSWTHTHTLEITGRTIYIMLHECSTIRFWRYAEFLFHLICMHSCLACESA